MLREKQGPKELKVTDKRIFTAEGEIRDEFKNEIKPADPVVPPTAAETPEQTRRSDASETARQSADPRTEAPRGEERRRSVAEKAENPGTPFANFVQSLVMQTYMFLGMLRDPRSQQPIFDAEAARETIDILTLLKEKTQGNLTVEEADFFDTHLGELKLAYVQRTKKI